MALGMPRQLFLSQSTLFYFIFLIKNLLIGPHNKNKNKVNVKDSNDVVFIQFSNCYESISKLR